MPQLLSSKNLLLSSRPLAVGVVGDQAALQHLLSLDTAAREATCDVVELRLDTLQMPAAELRQLLTGNTLPLLLTCRHPSEGGSSPTDPAARAAMIEPLLDLAALVDIELRTAQQMLSSSGPSTTSRPPLPMRCWRAPSPSRSPSGSTA